MKEHDATEIAYRNGYADGKPKWISVKERLPKCGERVLASDGCFIGEFYINKRVQWQRYNGLLTDLDILWWMQFPEPPEEDKTDV